MSSFQAMESILIKKCLKGQPEAQKELYQLYASQMLGICYRYTRSMQDAEDVLQEGFIKVFTKLGQFKGDGPLGAWIRKIMVHTAISHLQKKHPVLVELPYETGQLPAATEMPDIRMNEKDLADLIRSLPMGYQTIFNLHAVEGYSHVEIAKMLNIQEGSSRSQYARARNRLIQLLKESDILITKQKEHARQRV